MHKSFVSAAVFAVSVVFFGCGNGDDNSAVPDAGAKASTDAAAQADVDTSDVLAPSPLACTTVVSEANCDTTLRPFVFVHGTYGSGDNFAHVASLLTSNGYCPDHIIAVEYNSLGDSPGTDCTAPNTPQGCGKIDAAVTAILAKFPQFTQVDLAGHSQGTEHCGNYIGAGGVGAHADKIAHYINFSGIPNVGSVQTLSLSSQHDLMDTPHHATGTSVCTIPFPDASDGGASDDAGATADATTTAEGGAYDAGAAPACNVKQVTFIHQDHFAVAASTDSFIQVYRYLNGKDPMYTSIQCGDDPVTIQGLSETFADNTPVTGMIEVREVTTPRADGAPDMVLMGTAAGMIYNASNDAGAGAIQLKRGAYYEFAGYGSDGKLIGYQYFTPFMRSNYLVRFLTPASASDGSGVGSVIAAMSTNYIVRGPNHTALVARWAGGAFRQDLGASLTVDGSEVLTSGNSGADAFNTANLGGGVVGLFMYDANNNMKTDLGLVNSGPFLSFTDVFIDARTPNLVALSLTPGSEEPATVNKTVVISNWPSSGALLNVMFQ
jgi:pimeloyl-ACP methyl ester carboxylesterase